MKLYEPFTAAIFGGLVLTILTQHALHKPIKVSRSTIKVDKSDIYVESGHAPARKKDCDTFYIPSDATNRAAIIERLDVCDTVVIVEPTDKPSIVQEPVKDSLPASKAQADRELNDVQKAIKTAVEKIINMEEKKK